jgi:hypothetical protein
VDYCRPHLLNFSALSNKFFLCLQPIVECVTICASSQKIDFIRTSFDVEACRFLPNLRSAIGKYVDHCSLVFFLLCRHATSFAPLHLKRFRLVLGAAERQLLSDLHHHEQGFDPLTLLAAAPAKMVVRGLLGSGRTVSVR